MAKLVIVLALLVAGVGCSGNKSSQFSATTNDFVFQSLAFSPSSATAVGLHKYQDKNLDDMLDDLGPASLDRQRRFYNDFRKRMAAIKRDQLDAEARVDYDIIQDQISLALLDLNQIQSALHNPTVYVETLGNALFTPYVLNYAPLADRARHIIARLQKVPLFLDQASTNLESSPDIWTQVAIEENQGNLNLVDKTLRAGMPAELREDYNRAAAPALDAMRKFQAYLKDSLSELDDYDWRLGGHLYPQKFRLVLAAGVDPGSVLNSAEKDLQTVRARMLELALPLHRSMRHGEHAELAGPERTNQIVSEVLDRIAARHATRESYMNDARADLEEARRFVASKHLLTLPAHGNLQVVETPEFMRGIYSVGGFDPAPALEPKLGAFYWVTPIPKDWAPERVESKLREYNFYSLKLLSIHEAMPGHYVQFEYANEIEPQSRRVLRGVFGNGPYIEGWAQYATQMMLDEGFLDHSPELQLTFAKQELRVLANAILDIRLQMLNMTDQEALDLMEKQTFQEEEEATGKLQRAKLSSCQLPTYFVGWRGWIRVRDQYKQAKGSSYKLPDFNDRALKQGAVPLTSLGELLSAQ